jgi:hypothetical protein
MTNQPKKIRAVFADSLILFLVLSNLKRCSEEFNGGSIDLSKIPAYPCLSHCKGESFLRHA